MYEFDLTSREVISRLLKGIAFAWLAAFTLFFTGLLDDLAPQAAIAERVRSELWEYMLFSAVLVWLVSRAHSHVLLPARIFRRHPDLNERRHKVAFDIGWMSAGPALSVWLLVGVGMHLPQSTAQAGAGLLAFALIVFLESRAGPLADAILKRSDRMATPAD